MIGFFWDWRIEVMEAEDDGLEVGIGWMVVFYFSVVFLAFG